MNLVSAEIEQYAREVSSPEDELLQELTAYTVANIPSAQMLTGPLEGRLLALLVALSGAKTVLEIGTFTGYSALSMAAALPLDGHLFTCDLEPLHIQTAHSFFARSPHGKKITLLEGPAMESLQTLPRQPDLVFVDADKTGYPDYFTTLLSMIPVGGLLIFDNCLWSGRVLVPEDEESRAIDQLNRMVAECPQVENVLLTVRDGIQLLRKVS